MKKNPGRPGPVYFPGTAVRKGWLQFFVLPVLVILVIPITCVASTPPVQPSLLFSVSNNSPGQDTSLTLLFIWNGYVSYNKPPEYIIVEAFSVADGTRLGAFTVSRQNDSCESEKTCTYSTSVRSGNFPPGKFMLVAADPLSGASARQPVTVNGEGDGSKDFFRRFDHDRAFGLVSGVFASFLIVVLAILVREKKSR
ncbi:MAG: hypothetical protein WC294_01225 [Methanoregula sp.]|jgi:hypothetical protein